MKVQIIGLGNVGANLLDLMNREKEHIISLGYNVRIISISDSNGTIINDNCLTLNEVMEYKKNGWRKCKQYIKDYDALESIKNIESDVVVELTPSTSNGEPGLSHIREALKCGKNVVTANKGPLVVAYDELVTLAKKNNVQLLYEATVAAHLPIFCLLRSCFTMDRVIKMKGILNSTTNYIIGEIESGKIFKEALDVAIKAGWAETNYSDDIDGVDAARKLVILANSIFGCGSKLEGVSVTGIRNVEKIIRDARNRGMKVKLLCELERGPRNVMMRVSPQMIALDDPLATVNKGDMGVKLTFRNSGEVFVSVKYNSPFQTAQAVLNDIININQRLCA